MMYQITLILFVAVFGSVLFGLFMPIVVLVASGLLIGYAIQRLLNHCFKNMEDITETVVTTVPMCFCCFVGFSIGLILEIFYIIVCFSLMFIPMIVCAIIGFFVSAGGYAYYLHNK